MNRPGAGPQPLRGIPGFPGQQALPNRTTPLGSGRLQNGKPSNASNWGFGVPSGAPGLPTPQNRVPGGASSSFAQTLGSSQPATPLDLSEFPSLSGASLPQYHNAGQAIWANANQRAAQGTPVQRPQVSQGNVTSSSSSQQQNHQAQEQAQQTLDDAFFTSSQLNNSLNEFRHANQGGVGQLSGSSQHQASAVDEFPPLGRNGHGEIGQDRRGNMIQSASAGGGFGSGSAFASGPSTSRTPAEALNQIQNGVSDQKKTPANNASLFSSLNSELNMRSDTFEEHQCLQSLAQNHGPSSQSQQYQGNFANDLMDSPVGTQARVRTPLSQMSELDRFGLPGLLEKVKQENGDASSLAIGQDLTTLGLDLNSSEPLYPTFGGPFASQPARPLQAEFTLPQCYTVVNVHKLEEKVPSFSDETLLYIFYTMTRDVMQEVAAIELTHRNWRYHKKLQVWLTKEPGYADPQPVSHEAERGRYVVFNVRQWQRESREMVLRWADLDDHISLRQSGPAMP